MPPPSVDVRLAPFLIASLAIHALILAVGVHFISSPGLSYFDIPTIKVHISPQSNTAGTRATSDSKIIKPLSSDSILNPYTSQQGNQITSQQLWQQSKQAVQTLIEEERYLDIFKRQQPSTANRLPGLFDQTDAVTTSTMESFRYPDGDIGVVFRYPSGKVICVKASEADPLDSFSFGTWRILLTGCP